MLFRVVDIQIKNRSGEFFYFSSFPREENEEKSLFSFRQQLIWRQFMATGPNCNPIDLPIVERTSHFHLFPFHRNPSYARSNVDLTISWTHSQSLFFWLLQGRARSGSSNCRLASWKLLVHLCIQFVKKNYCTGKCMHPLEKLIASTTLKAHKSCHCVLCTSVSQSYAVIQRQIFSPTLLRLLSTLT